MEPAIPWQPKKPQHPGDDQDETEKVPSVRARRRSGILEHDSISTSETAQEHDPSLEETAKSTHIAKDEIDQRWNEALASPDIDPVTPQVLPSKLPTTESHQEDRQEVSSDGVALEEIDTLTMNSIPQEATGTTLDRQADEPQMSSFLMALELIDTQKSPSMSQTDQQLPNTPSLLPLQKQAKTLSTRQVLFLISLLVILLLHATNVGPTLFAGSQGWASVLGTPINGSNPNLLQTIGKQVQAHATPGASTHHNQLTPQQYIDLIVHNMTLDQKLGQMMMVQFIGSDYSPELNAMLSQYNVGSVVLFYANNNIIDKTQLKNLDQQMQSGRTIPLAIATDQEGGQVDRLVHLDGPRPAASTIGATNNPAVAKAAGIQDAQDLSTYGINLNLAPVVDITNVYSTQLYMRTYGNDPTRVAQMASAYLQGLQQSGKVVGTLKHFPGLGDVSDDPHQGVPYLRRSKSGLEQIDWMPYRTLIQQGNVHAIMVTHEVVTALDSTLPSSLSKKVVQGILRDELGFQGVIMTDSLTMKGVTDFYPPAQIAAMAVEAGSDLLMGAGSPNEVATMIDGIKQAMSSGAISQQRIDDSVRRILLMKYTMGLLPIPQQ